MKTALMNRTILIFKYPPTSPRALVFRTRLTRTRIRSASLYMKYESTHFVGLEDSNIMGV
jgi:hypothetical protein